MPGWKAKKVPWPNKGSAHCPDYLAHLNQLLESILGSLTINTMSLIYTRHQENYMNTAATVSRPLKPHMNAMCV